MARILGLFPSSLIAAREGMSANAFYRELRNLGLAARRTEVLQLYKIATSIIARSPEEPLRDITTAPTNDQLVEWPTKKATDVRQNISVVYRDRTTGHISRVPYSVSSENGVIREQAMAQAIDAYAAHAEEYNQDLIGAVHTGVYRYTPIVV